VRPAEPKKSTVAARKEARTPPPLPTPATPLAHNPPRPIGPDALKRIREAIQSGEYPSDAVVRSGLERLIRRPD